MNRNLAANLLKHQLSGSQWALMVALDMLLDILGKDTIQVSRFDLAEMIPWGIRGATKSLQNLEKEGLLVRDGKWGRVPVNKIEPNLYRHQVVKAEQLQQWSELNPVLRGWLIWTEKLGIPEKIKELLFKELYGVSMYEVPSTKILRTLDAPEPWRK